MNRGTVSQEDLFEYFVPEQADEMDDSFLELLCEDGFLDTSELEEEDFPGHRLILLKRAMKRGFQKTGRRLESLSEAVRIIVKRSDSLRHWKDIVRQTESLRAPPFYMEEQGYYI